MCGALVLCLLWLSSEPPTPGHDSRSLVPLEESKQAAKTGDSPRSDGLPRRSAAEQIEALMRSERGILRLRMVDRDSGRPVAAAMSLVLAYGPNLSREAITDGSGRLEIADFPFPCTLRVHVRCDSEGVEDSNNGFVMRESPSEFQVPVTRRILVSGTIRSTEGAPVAKSRVVSWGAGSDSSESSCLSQPDGGFRLFLDGVGRPLMVQCSGPAGYRYQTVEAEPVSDRHYNANLTLARASVTSGVVKSESGAPRSGVRVRIQTLRFLSKDDASTEPSLAQRLGAAMTQRGNRDGTNRVEMIEFEALTDRDGKFAVSPFLPANELIVLIQAPDATPFVRRIRDGLSDGGEDQDLGEILLRNPANPISMRLHFSDGTPFAERELILVRADVPTMCDLSSGPLKTDAQGILRSSFLEDGVEYLVASHVLGSPLELPRLCAHDGGAYDVGTLANDASRRSGGRFVAPR